MSEELSHLLKVYLNENHGKSLNDLHSGPNLTEAFEAPRSLPPQAKTCFYESLGMDWFYARFATPAGERSKNVSTLRTATALQRGRRHGKDNREWNANERE
jgi:hypothetical protein